MVKKKSSPERGDIWWVSFDPSIGSEIKKTRPAIIISNDFSNLHLSRFQVIPITSNIDKLYPSEAYVNVGKKKGKAMTDQITTISKERLVKFESKLSKNELQNVENALEIQLGLL